ncbi:hypothetical protein QEL91_005660 [Pseudomonas putida]|nr:hypothetical protein [Pseudomonas putida]
MIKLLQRYLLSIYKKDIASAHVLVQEFSEENRPRSNSLDLSLINNSSAWVGWSPIPDYMNGQREIFEGDTF